MTSRRGRSPPFGTAYLWVGTAPGAVSYRLTSPGSIAIEVDGNEFASGNGVADIRETALAFGEHRVRIIAGATEPGETSVRVSLDGRVRDARNLLYATSTGDGGFQAVYRSGGDFSRAPELITHIPFAVSALALPGMQSVDYRGLIDVPIGGEYGFAINSGVSAKVFVDGELVVDNGGAHEIRLAEGAAAMPAGQHLVSIQFSGDGRADWALYLRPPGAAWKQADGSEFTVPVDTLSSPPETMRP